MFKKIIFLSAIFLLLGAGCGNPFKIETPSMVGEGTYEKVNTAE